MKNRIYIISSLVFVAFALSVYALAIKTGNRNAANPIKAQATNLKNIGSASSLNKSTASRIPLNASKFIAKSYAFNSGGIIPLKYVCNKIAGGENTSIPIEWTNAPAGTRSYAVYMYDLNPVAKNFVHWAVINISYNVYQILEGASATQYMPVSGIELKNSSGSIGYTGPCPPAGTGRHEYKIIVYALNTETLNLSGFVPLNKFQAAIKGKVLSQSEISGFFEQ